jgi:NAD/NADP transhydrogenase beta subunit
MTVYTGDQPSRKRCVYVMVALGFLFGILLVLPIGAADMPVVIPL